MRTCGIPSPSLLQGEASLQLMYYSTHEHLHQRALGISHPVDLIRWLSSQAQTHLQDGSHAILDKTLIGGGLPRHLSGVRPPGQTRDRLRHAVSRKDVNGACYFHGPSDQGRAFPLNVIPLVRPTKRQSRPGGDWGLLPHLLRGDPHLNVIAIPAFFAGRSNLDLMSLRSQPSLPEEAI